MAIFDPRVLGARPTGLRRERVEASPRFEGGRFHNTEPLSSNPERGEVAWSSWSMRSANHGVFFSGDTG